MYTSAAVKTSCNPRRVLYRVITCALYYYTHSLTSKACVHDVSQCSIPFMKLVFMMYHNVVKFELPLEILCLK